MQAVDKKGYVVREPENNAYGRLRVLQRTDGLYVVHDTEAAGISFGPVFRTEVDAREWASTHC